MELVVYGLLVDDVAWQIVTFMDVGVGLEDVWVGVGVGEAGVTVHPAFAMA
jgi:hypothetical protein